MNPDSLAYRVAKTLPPPLFNTIKYLVKDLLPSLWKTVTGFHVRRKEIDRIQNELQTLKDSFYSTQRIDLVQVDGFYLFTYMDDFFYKYVVQPGNRCRSVSQLEEVRSRDTVTRSDPGEYLNTWTDTGSTDEFLLGNFIRSFDEFTLIDIGCLYGRTTLNYARFMRRFGADQRIVCFDPGNAGSLAGYNFINNGYDNIEYYPYGISNHDGYSLVHMEYGVNENNRLINRLGTEKSASRVIKSVTIDTFLAENNIDMPLFVKMDTQGGELEVFSGMKNTIDKQPVAGIAEFFPKGLKTRISPARFLGNLLENFTLFDAGARRDRLREVTRENMHAYVREVRLGEYPWSDIIFISHKFPGVEDIISKLSSLCTGRISQSAPDISN